MIYLVAFLPLTEDLLALQMSRSCSSSGVELTTTKPSVDDVVFDGDVVERGRHARPIEISSRL
jgi:hypothetical protein